MGLCGIGAQQRVYFGVRCYDWSGKPQGKSCLRVDDCGDVGKGYLIGDHLIASDGFYE